MSDSAEIKSLYLSKIDERIRGLNGHAGDSSNRLRIHGRESFEKAEFPTRRDEDYKYTSFKSLLETRFEVATSVNGETPIPDTFDAYTFVFVDGVLVSSPQEALPAGIVAGRLSDAWDRAELQDKLEKLTSRITDAEVNVFESMGLGLSTDPMFIHAESGTVVEKPIHFVYLSSGKPEASSHPYHVIDVERSADFTLVETFHGTGDAEYYTNAANRIFVAANANLKHYRLQTENYASYHTANTTVVQERDSKYGIYIAELGSRLMRDNIHIVHTDENITSDIYGLFISREKQHIDTQSFIDHATPHCESNELFKGILLDYGRGVFNGKIIVRPDAQKINAYQQNAALVLSPNAVMDSKPQLEIFADDVRCSHGATIGQLDPESLFYLKARGLNDTAAKALLKKAFLKDVVDQFPDEAIANYFLAALEDELDLIASKNK